MFKKTWGKKNLTLNKVLNLIVAGNWRLKKNLLQNLPMDSNWLSLSTAERSLERHLAVAVQSLCHARLFAIP